MNLRFLCANHRQWLMSDIRRAEQAWLEWTERGALLCEEGDYPQAIPLLGCAFELSDFLLSAREPGYTVAARRFTDGARMLIEAYRQWGETGHAKHVLVLASSRLARELEDRANHQFTTGCIRMLYSVEVSVADTWQGQVIRSEPGSMSQKVPMLH
ncbi:hypothetical protein PVT68_10990 [Microbulbifer bruguierae]|uniref:Uncharacterized protein n=1 Tax=Microbulbifer bruguierae TaxID=3029061 RepID=A0ABY8N9H1_9GAMM|nr:hypothetical protein [Microbulbifer bruguierae]WGL15295.1 hypothetical protein PVT68_10990 [Microbulbifer bruguierae]